jgi:hypothetical protein
VVSVLTLLNRLLRYSLNRVGGKYKRGENEAKEKKRIGGCWLSAVDERPGVFLGGIGVPPIRKEERERVAYLLGCETFDAE